MWAWWASHLASMQAFMDGIIDLDVAGACQSIDQQLEAHTDDLADDEAWEG